MTKAKSASSARGRRVARSGAPIVQYALTPTEIARQRALGAKPQPPDSEIDFSDIPEASEAWLAQAQRARAVRLGQLAQPLAPARRKVSIALRVDPVLLAAVKDLARARHVKYQTLVQQLLAGAVVREVEAREVTR